MGIKSGVEYCDSSVNPLMGCGGCELYDPDPKKSHCYAAALCRRMAGLKGWPDEFSVAEMFPGRLDKAIGWSDLTGKERPEKPWLNGMPRVIFVNDLSDSFTPHIDPWVWLGPHILDMEKSPHVWLLLTKRPQNMRLFFDTLGYVPKNFVLGTTVTSGMYIWRAKALADMLHRFPDAKLWLSIEPLLGPPIKLRDAFELGPPGYPSGRAYRRPELDLVWLAAGGESQHVGGAIARPSHPDWFMDVRNMCVEYGGIPFFFKQWGEWVPYDPKNDKHERLLVGWENDDVLGDFVQFIDGTGSREIRTSNQMTTMIKVGTRKSGRVLDGETHLEMFDAG